MLLENGIEVRGLKMAYTAYLFFLCPPSVLECRTPRLGSRPEPKEPMQMVTIDDVRRVALSLPRTEEHLIRDRVKFRVGRIVYVAFSRDEKIMGFGYPKEERTALVAA